MNVSAHKGTVSKIQRMDGYGIKWKTARKEKLQSNASKSRSGTDIFQVIKSGASSYKRSYNIRIWM